MVVCTGTDGIKYELIAYDQTHDRRLIEYEPSAAKKGSGIPNLVCVEEGSKLCFQARPILDCRSLQPQRAFTVFVDGTDIRKDDMTKMATGMEHNCTRSDIFFENIRIATAQTFENDKAIAKEVVPVGRIKVVIDATSTWRGGKNVSKKEYVDPEEVEVLYGEPVPIARKKVVSKVKSESAPVQPLVNDENIEPQVKPENVPSQDYSGCQNNDVLPQAPLEKPLSQPSCKNIKPDLAQTSSPTKPAAIPVYQKLVPETQKIRVCAAIEKETSESDQSDWESETDPEPPSPPPAKKTKALPKAQKKKTKTMILRENHLVTLELGYTDLPGLHEHGVDMEQIYAAGLRERPTDGTADVPLTIDDDEEEPVADIAMSTALDPVPSAPVDPILIDLAAPSAFTDATTQPTQPSMSLSMPSTSTMSSAVDWDAMYDLIEDLNELDDGEKRVLRKLARKEDIQLGRVFAHFLRRGNRAVFVRDVREVLADV